MGNEIENLTNEQVVAALAAGGYTFDEVIEATFIGYNVRGDKARYEIRYEDMNSGEMDRGVIFVENVPGVGFVADF